MSIENVPAVVAGAAAVLAALFYLGRRALKGIEALLLALVPVIRALSEVREAWRALQSARATTDSEEEQPRALS